MMDDKDFRLPETAIKNSNCFDDGFMFHQEAYNIAAKIEEILLSFAENEAKQSPLYTNNVIGILGGRGTGKTSLMASLSSTLSKRPESAPFASDHDIKVYPLFNDIIDPKVLPDCVGIVDLAISALFNDFKEWTSNCSGDESGELDETIDLMYDRFEKLGKDIKIFYAKERNDAFEATTDLHDISGLIKIRSEIEELISRLLKIKNGNSSNAKSAFLLLIDDFDLDFSNCYQMVFDIMSLLNVRGLVILLALDEETFKLEFVREMVKKQSDYGQASPALFGYPGVRVLSDSRAVARGFPGYNVMNIIKNQEKYFDQVYVKFLPLDSRFRTRGHDINEVGGAAFQNRFSGFCEWLFGFQPTWRGKRRDSQRTMTEMFYDAFFGALSEKDDLRVRNQGINRLLALWDARASGLNSDTLLVEEVSGVFDTFMQTANNANRTFWKRIIDSLSIYALSDKEKIERYKSEHRASMLSSSNSGPISIYELGKDFFEAHPAGYAAYEVMVDFLSPDSQGRLTLFEDYIKILQIFVNRDVEITIIPTDGNKDLAPFELLKIGNYCELDVDSLANSLFEDRRELLDKKIQDTLRLSGKMTKTEVRLLLASILVYINKQGIDVDEIEPFIEEIREALKEKWAGKNNEKDDSVRRISNALRMIRRRL